MLWKGIHSSWMDLIRTEIGLYFFSGEVPSEIGSYLNTLEMRIITEKSGFLIIRMKAGILIHC